MSQCFSAKIGRPILNGIKFIKEPAKAPPANQKLAWILQLAHKLCSHFGYGVTGVSFDMKNDLAVQALNIENAEVDTLLEDIPEEIAIHLASLNG